MNPPPPRLCSKEGPPPHPLVTGLHYLSSFLLELLDGSLVDAPAFVDEVTRGGGLAGVHVADHHDVDVEFFLSHGGWSLTRSVC